jgi:putative cardiolipin synthase
MNFDQRSRYLNTETGLIIDSPELASQTAARFEEMTRPDSAYAVSLQTDGRMVWHTLEHEKPVEYTREPSDSSSRRLEAKLLYVLPRGEL